MTDALKRARVAAEFAEPTDPQYKSVTEDVPRLVTEVMALRVVLRGLYEAVHAFLDVHGYPAAGAPETPRLNGALAAAFDALAPEPQSGPVGWSQADEHFPVGAEQGAPRLRPGEEP